MQDAIPTGAMIDHLPAPQGGNRNYHENKREAHRTWRHRAMIIKTGKILRMCYRMMKKALNFF
jgi:hypothetical protein